MINTTSISNLQQFSYKDKKIRTVTVEGESWWVAKDVCDILNLSDVSMSVAKLDDDEKLIQTFFVSGQNRDMMTVNESGLYALIIRSNKPEAKAFRKWITSEILPQIRRTGKYSIPTSAIPGETEPAIDDNLISNEEAAGILGISPCTLRNWRYLGRGPKPTMVGKLVRYYRSDIQRFIRTSNSGNSLSRSVLREGVASASVPHNIADLAAEAIDQFSGSMVALANYNAQDGHFVLAKIFSHKIKTDDGWVSVKEVIRLLTSDHISRGVDPLKRMACERMLKNTGIRLELDTDKNWILWISNSLGAMARILADTSWPKRWCTALKMIPGALHKDLMRFTGSPTAATGIPLKETTICTEIVVPANTLNISPLDQIAPGTIEMINKRYRITKNTRITNAQLVYIVLHAVSNAHLLKNQV